MRMIATHYIFTQDYSKFFFSFLLIDGGLRCGVIEVIYDRCKILSMLACVMLSNNEFKSLLSARFMGPVIVIKGHDILFNWENYYL